MELILAAGAVMLVSLSGVLFVSRVAESFLLNRLTYLVSFAAGVFLITVTALSFKVFEIVEQFWLGALLIIAGYALAAIMHWLLPEAQIQSGDKDKPKTKAAKKLLVADGIHNLADGVVLAVAYAASPVLGIITTISVVIHETLQEIAEFFVLRRAGYSTLHALLINFAVSSTILVGVVIGVLALATTELEGLLLAVSAGFFAHVVINDLLPKPKNHETKISLFKHLGIVLMGLILMGSINLMLGDVHKHGEDKHEEEHHDKSSEEYHKETVWWVSWLNLDEVKDSR